MDNFDIARLKKQFLACVPLAKLELPKKLSPEIQSLILEQIMNDSLLKKYPVKNNYLKNFLRLLIKRLESDNEEIDDSLYEIFCQHLSLEDSRMNYRHFLIDPDKRVIIKESRTIVSDGTTGLCSWQAAEVLAEWCIENKIFLAGKSIVELGSGVGLTGITVLKTCRPKSYTFTDCHPRVLDLLEENIELNELKKADETIVQVEELAWESISEHKEANWTSPDIILAADVVYDSSVFSSLINAIYVLLKNSINFAIIGVTVRNQDTLEGFLRELEKHKLGYKELPLPEYKIFEAASVPVKIIRIQSIVE
ncbi:hypothetical protein KQX54_017508 [Cotesia glomerata]|uniref:FAM86 N-terminal domain-containing protein n=1 Tax=Cotesia glomerata TaxID=32391 RepID=A0AAV7J076_COTGL|nr:hypothetical protein KQX54_017508 [Cotesia glomerata]